MASMSNSNLHTIEHFRRLRPEVQQDLAKKYDLYEPNEDPASVDANTLLLRAHQKGKLYDLGRDVQLAPQ